MSNCQVCGHDNPETNKFCGECAAPLPTAEPASEVRKTVTVVFCDVVGSTAMGEALDPESLRHVMERFFGAMQAAIERHGGTVEKFIGDAVMAVFGVPQVHEDDALRATRAAAEMRTALAALNEDLDRDHGMTLACRIGVNTGKVVAGGGDQKIVTGDAVNVAARLEQAASAGEILLGEDTYALVSGAVLAEPIEGLQAKGKIDPVPAFRLIEVTPGAAGFARHLDAPIVGRERELALLRSAFERTVTDHACQLFTILGVGGVGKSRLMAAFVEELGDRATVLRGRCLPYGEGITFWPLAEALREAADLQDADTPDAGRAKLAALAGSDDVAERVAERVGQTIGIPGSQTAADETLWAIRVLLERVAAQRPLVFVIDDLQWAEPKFLELVEHVSDLARDAPILLACMARPELLADHSGWGGGKLNATSILVEPLDPEECGALVANLLADDTVDEAVRSRIAEAAEGHPLYAEEITGLLVDEGRLVLKEDRWVATGDLSDVPVPPTISALLAARLDTLPLPERRVMDLASVMGQIFYSNAVRDLADEDAEAVEARLTSLVRKQFIRPERSDLPGAEALAFRHLLLCDAAYDAIPKATRARLHERFAGWLEAAAKGSMSELDEIVGYHLELAVTYRAELGPLDEAALTLSKEAGRRLISSGRRAWNRGDGSSTINLTSRAVGLPLIETADRIDALIMLAPALLGAGRFDEVAPVLRECSDLASEAGDDSAKLESELQMIMLELSIHPSASFVESARQVEAMIAELDKDGSHRDLARAWHRLGVIRFWGGAAASALEALALAYQHASDAADRGLALEALWSMTGSLLWGPTPVDEVIQECARIKGLAPDDRRINSSYDMLEGYCLVVQGHFDEGITLATRALVGWEELGLTLDLASARGMFLGVILALAGRTTEAVRLQRGAVDTLTQIGETGYLSTVAAYLAITEIGSGEPDEAQHHALLSRDSAAKDDLASQVLWRTALAAVATSHGDLVEAEQLAREAVELARAMDYLVMLADALVILGDVLRKVDLPEEARATMAEAAALYERKGYRVGYSVGL